MSDFVTDAIAKLQAAILANPVGVSEIRFADGRSMKYGSRQDMIDELARLQSMQQPELSFTRLRCRGDN